MDESATIFLYRVNMHKDKAASSHLGEEIFIVMYYLYVCRHAYRRRTKTDANAKVVASVWGTEFSQFLAALGILYKDDFEE